MKQEEMVREMRRSADALEAAGEQEAADGSRAVAQYIEDLETAVRTERKLTAQLRADIKRLRGTND